MSHTLYSSDGTKAIVKTNTTDDYVILSLKTNLSYRIIPGEHIPLIWKNNKWCEPCENQLNHLNNTVDTNVHTEQLIKESNDYLKEQEPATQEDISKLQECFSDLFHIVKHLEARLEDLE